MTRHLNMVMRPLAFASGLVLALVLALMVVPTASGDQPAAAVRSCTAPTGTITDASIVGYVKCRFNRLEKLTADQQPTGGSKPARCEAPTGTITHKKLVTYSRCRFNRLEKLTADQQPTGGSTPARCEAPTGTITHKKLVGYSRCRFNRLEKLTAGGQQAPAPTPTPGPAGYPDASNTGVPAGTTLTTVNGNVSLNTAGQVYADKRVNGCIEVNAPNVTISRVLVTCQGASAVYNNSTDLLVEDTTIDCGSDGVAHTGLGPRNYTARRVNAFGCENIFWSEQNVLVVDSYLHDTVPFDPVRDPHTDSVQIPSGASNIVIRHNRIYGGYNSQSDFGNAAITMGGNVSGIVVDDNVLAGGGYTLYCEQESIGGNGSPQPRYTNNRFSTVYRSTVGGFGPSTDCGDEIQSGNVIHETGKPLTLR